MAYTSPHAEDPGRQRSLRTLKTEASSLVAECQVHGHPKDNQALQGDIYELQHGGSGHTLSCHFLISSFRRARERAESDTVLLDAQSSALAKEATKGTRSPVCPPQGATGKQTIPKALRGIFDPVFILQNGLDVGVGDDNIVQF